MKSDNDNHIEPERSTTSSQMSAQSETEDTGHADTLSEGGNLSDHPISSSDTIRTEGGAYIAGSVMYQGGVNQSGGTMGNVKYIDKRQYITLPTPPPPTSPGRPENYIPFLRNRSFQPRPGEFEAVESLLKQACE